MFALRFGFALFSFLSLLLLLSTKYLLHLLCLCLFILFSLSLSLALFLLSICAHAIPASRNRHSRVSVFVSAVRNVIITPVIIILRATIISA